MTAIATAPVSAETAQRTERLASYSALLAEIDRHGQGKFSEQERAALTGAADALLFDDTPLEEACEDAEKVLGAMESGRLSGEAVQRLRDCLAGCAAPAGE